MDNTKNKNRVYFLLAAVFMFYLGESIYGYIFNNYIEQVPKIGTDARGLLEFPRELPGVLSVFVISALFFMGEGAIAALASFLLAGGLIAMTLPGFVSSYWLLILWITVASFGQHFFLVVVDAIVLHNASPENRSVRLGQMKGLITAAGLVASIFIWIKWKYVSENFSVDFIIAAVLAIAAGIIFMSVKVGDFKKCKSWRDRIVLKKKYMLYYALETFFGARKQIFLTFGFWLMVSTLGKGAEYMGITMFMAGVFGLFFRPFIGKMIQVFGERKALITESVLILVICMFYAFSMKVFSLETATLVLTVCFAADSAFFAFGMARSSYLARTVERKEELTPSLYSGMAINHVTSIIGAVLGGYIWKYTNDHMWVFLFLAVLSVAYGITAFFIRDAVKPVHSAS